MALSPRRERPGPSFRTQTDPGAAAELGRDHSTGSRTGASLQWRVWATSPKRPSGRGTSALLLRGGAPRSGLRAPRPSTASAGTARSRGLAGHSGARAHAGALRSRASPCGTRVCVAEVSPGHGRRREGRVVLLGGICRYGKYLLRGRCREHRTEGPWVSARFPREVPVRVAFSAGTGTEALLCPDKHALGMT